MDDLKNFFLGVLAELVAHFLIRKLEEKEALSRHRPKHMREG